jgi:hypothetical protein
MLPFYKSESEEELDYRIRKRDPKLSKASTTCDLMSCDTSETHYVSPLNNVFGKRVGHASESATIVSHTNRAFSELQYLNHH